MRRNTDPWGNRCCGGRGHIQRLGCCNIRDCKSLPRLLHCESKANPSLTTSPEGTASSSARSRRCRFRVGKSGIQTRPRHQFLFIEQSKRGMCQQSAILYHLGGKWWNNSMKQTWKLGQLDTANKKAMIHYCTCWRDKGSSRGDRAMPLIPGDNQPLVRCKRPDQRRALPTHQWGT